jgi:hypothetical protein
MDTYSLNLSRDQIQLVVSALAELPVKIALGTYMTVVGQISAQEQQAMQPAQGPRSRGGVIPPGATGNMC